MPRPRFAAICVILLIAVVLSGCSGGSPERRRSEAVRLGQAGTALVDGVDTVVPDLTAAQCVLASAVIVYTKAPNQTFGEYTLADVRPEYPNSRVSSLGPVLGPIYAHYHSVLECTDVQPTGSDFTLAFRSVRVEPPVWDDANLPASRFTFGWPATDDEHVQELFVTRTNLSVPILVSWTSADVADRAYHMAFDVSASQDIDAAFAGRIAANPSVTHVRFWADRPETQPSGGLLFVPVAIDIEASNVTRTTRYDHGVITGRFDLIPPLFTGTGSVSQGNVTVFDDVRITLSQPFEHLLRRPWISDRA